MARLERLELPTYCLEGSCSIQLSYRRTYDQRTGGRKIGAGDENRTHVTSLEGWNSTIELHPPVFSQLIDSSTVALYLSRRIFKKTIKLAGGRRDNCAGITVYSQRMCAPMSERAQSSTIRGFSKGVYFFFQKEMERSKSPARAGLSLLVHVEITVYFLVSPL